jgi:hypothetical protein
MPDINAGAELVKRAFDAARVSGKDNWHRMTVPVLKNRILMVTGGKFREADFGASSFRDFISRLPAGLLSLDETESPAVAVLTEKEAQHGAPGTSFARVRSDLWRAVLDYSSGHRYAWDASRREARVAAPDESAPILPTVTADGFREWRVAFAKTQSEGVTGSDGMRLKRWTDESLPTAFLPTRLRPLWNAELKRCVETTLQEWFKKNAIEPPIDLVTVDAPPITHDAAQNLRQFVLDCVRAMSARELAELPIPAAAALRARAKTNR